MPVKTGGSQASANVVKFVTPATFDKLNAMFTNKVSISGGNCKKNIPNVNINEEPHKMMVYNKNGGKKKNVSKVKRGGEAPVTADANSSGFNFSSYLNQGNSPNPNLPPSALPTRIPSSLNPNSIPASQQLLSTQQISTMSPITKTTVYPALDSYKGDFAFGGAKKKAVKGKKQPKAKKAVVGKKVPAKNKNKK
jgi:hypothetical protein